MKKPLFLIAPSQGKSKIEGSSGTIKIENLFLNDKNIEKHRNCVIDSYLHMLKTASENEIKNLFGSKNLDLEMLALCANMRTSNTLRAINLYTGVAFYGLIEGHKGREFGENLQKIIIFSNLFGPIIASDYLPFYNLYQGQNIRNENKTLSPKDIFTPFKELLDEYLAGKIVFDLRPNFYKKLYKITDSTEIIECEFHKNGKKLSHHSKFYRGFVAGKLLDLDISSANDAIAVLGNLDEIALIENKNIKNINYLKFEIRD